MKKVSTVAAKASKKISQQKLTVGLDLGDRNRWYCVLDESGQIQLPRPTRRRRTPQRQTQTDYRASQLQRSAGPPKVWKTRAF